MLVATAKKGKFNASQVAMLVCVICLVWRTCVRCVCVCLDLTGRQQCMCVLDDAMCVFHCSIAARHRMFLLLYAGRTNGGETHKGRNNVYVVGVLLSSAQCYRCF